MSLPILLRPEAKADLLAARDWYEQQRAGLGDEFAEAVEQLLARIQIFPELYGVLLSKVRGGKLRRFPYVLYYRALPDRIEVLAVLHGSRNPPPWLRRL